MAARPNTCSNTCPSKTVLHVGADGMDIPVEVVRKRVKNLNLRVRSDGSVTLSMPPRCPLVTAEEFLARKSGWIVERVRRRVESDGVPVGPWAPGIPGNADGERPVGGPGMMKGGKGAESQPGLGTKRPFRAPDSLPLWGVNLDTGRALGMDRAQLGALDIREFSARIQALYKSEIARKLPEVTKRFESALGVRASRWSLRTMKTRWGSCTPSTGAIRINTRLAAYPPECLEFVVAHELVHLLEPSHNARFHALLDELYPANRAAAALLKKKPSAS